MEKNKYNVWIWVIIIIVAAGVFFFVLGRNNTVVPVATNTTNTTIESTQDTSGVTGIAAVSISYANALVKYANRRIQLETNCQAAKPNVVTYKDNTGIMIDNRSPSTRTVKVGTIFTIKPWSFKIVVLPNVYLKSKTLLVDCDKSQNVATILVQE